MEVNVCSQNSLPSECSEGQCLKQLFSAHYEEIKELPMVKQFIIDNNNKNLLQKALFNGDIETIGKLNSAFKKFYKRQKAVKYVIGIIKRYSIDYDKRVKKRNNRYLLTLDKPIISNDESSSTSLLELIQDRQQGEFVLVLQPDIFDIENEQLRQAIDKAKLNSFQKKLLTLIYKENYSQREVSKMVGQTEQNIYYWHKKTIKQIQKGITINF